MLSQINVPFELKAGGKNGEFEGYGAVFSNKDLGDDIILPGAFEQVKTTKDGKVRIALYHDLSRLIGKAEYVQDDHGLHLKGQMNMDVSYAKDAYHLMKDGTLDGMSVGFDILPDGSEWKKDDNDYVRVISKAELWEVSVVPFGMNPDAKLSNVKDITGNIRHFEKFLRKHGFSRRQAMAIAANGFKAIECDTDSYKCLQSDSVELNSETLENLKNHFANNFKI